MDGVRHVFVRAEHSPVECAGLVLDWKRDGPGEWLALVTYVEPRGRVVSEWLPADRMRPVTG